MKKTLKTAAVLFALPLVGIVYLAKELSKTGQGQLAIIILLGCILVFHMATMTKDKK